MNFASVFNPKIIFKSWVDSLKIFLPSNLIPFLSTTLKSFVEGVRAVGTQVLWRFVMIGLALVGILLLHQMRCPNCPFAESYSTRVVIIFLLMAAMLFLYFIMAIRQTVEPKDYAYFKRNRSVLLGAILIFVIWFFTGLWIANFVVGLSYMLTIIIMELFFLGFFLTIFFFIESMRSPVEIVKSFGRAFIFCIFNIPGLAILIGLSLLIETVFELVKGLFPEAVWVYWLFGGILIIEIMILTCILYNYFIQRVNANKNLYS